MGSGVPDLYPVAGAMLVVVSNRFGDQHFSLLNELNVCGVHWKEGVSDENSMGLSDYSTG